MSLPANINTAARTPYSEAASLEHYSSKSVNELKILAKIHGIPDGAEPRDIVAILMEKDRVNGVWPGMFEDPEKEVTKGSRVAPVKQTSKETETRSETNIATRGQSKSASVATVLNNNKIAETPTAAMTATGSENDTAIPISQLRKEWDGLWGPPFAFSKVAPVDPKSQGTSITSAGSTPIRSKSPVSPASSASLKSNRYEVLATEEKELVEPEELLTDTVEEDIPTAKMSMQSAPSVFGESLATQTFSHQVDGEENVHLANENAEVGEKTKKKGKRGKKGGRKVNKANTDAAQSAATEIEKTEPSTSDASISSKQVEDVPLPVSPAKVESTEGKVEFTLEVSGPLPVVQENDGAIVEPSTSVAPTEIDEHIEEQTNVDQFWLINVEDTEGSPLPIEIPNSQQSAASPSEPTVESSEKAPIHIFPVAPPVPLPSTQTAQTLTPPMTKNQRRNEKRNESKQAATLSNMYDVLMSEQSGDASTPDSSDIKEDENKGNSEGTAPAAKKKKRGTKGGKKAQAQKKHQPVPIVETTATPIAETVAGPVIQTAVATKIQPMHLALGAVVAILAGAVGTWATV
ncbi:unnamed protein product [Alternaria alternata]